jgi:hypothetical protein
VGLDRRNAPSLDVIDKAVVVWIVARFLFPLGQLEASGCISTQSGQMPRYLVVLVLVFLVFLHGMSATVTMAAAIAVTPAGRGRGRGVLRRRRNLVAPSPSDPGAGKASGSLTRRFSATAARDGLLELRVEQN